MNADIILIQEAHPDAYLIKKYLTIFANKFYIHWSACKHKDTKQSISAAGGLISMVAKDKVDSDADISFFIAEHGRAAKLTLSLQGHTTNYWNIHNYGFNRTSIKRLIRLLRADIEYSNENPQFNSTWCIGDFNRDPEDFPRIDLKDPSKLSYPVPGENSTNNFGFIWDSLFDDMVEITSAEPSHFVAEGLFLNKIDRAFTTTPPHAWLTVRPAINTIIKADDAHANGLSDHAMQLISVSLHAPPNPSTMPIKAEVFKHKMFKYELQKLYDYINLDALATWERWETHKVVPRHAAIKTRDHMLINEENSNFTIQGTISSLARAIWHNDSKLANTIIERSDFAKEHVKVIDGKVTSSSDLTWQDTGTSSVSTSISIG